LKGRGYSIYQQSESVANIRPNSVGGINKGTVRVVFRNSEFIFVPNGGSLSGNIYGDKLFNLEGRMYCIEMRSKLLAQIDSNPDPSSMFKTRKLLDDCLDGKIIRINSEIVNRFKRETFARFSGVEPKGFTIVGHVSGIWHKHVESEGVKYWDSEWLPDEIEDPE
jgi:hypothetical protein